MDRTMSLGLVVGATLNGSVGRVLQTIKGKTDALSKSLDKNRLGKALAADVIKYRTVLDSLKRKQKQTGESSDKLNRQIEHITKQYKRSKKAAKAYGIQIGDVVRQHKLLTQSAERTDRKLKRLATRQRNKDVRGEIQGQMLSTVAQVMAAALPIKKAMQFESAMADVRKVIDFDSPEQFKQMQYDILEMSTKMPMAAEKIAEIVTAAGRAGIAREELMKFTADAVRMGIAFDMSAGEAGAAMTGMRTIFGLNQEGVIELGDAYNYLDNNMDTTAADLVRIANKAGAVGKLFGLSGIEVGALGATFKALKTPTDVAGTAINAMLMKLKTADKQSGKFQEALGNIGYSAEGLKAAIEEDAQGALLSFLQAVRGSEDVMGNLSDLFGLEYADDISKLVGSLDVYEGALDKVGERTKFAGAMNTEYATRIKTTEANLDMFISKLTWLGNTIGATVLPALNSSMGALGGVVGVVNDAAQAVPWLTTGVIGAAVALTVFKVASLASRYAMTVLSDAWVFGKGVIDFFRLSTIKANASMIANGVIATGVAIKQKALAVGTAAMTAAQWLWNAAMTANPIGLVIAGVAALATGAYTLYKNWDSVTAWFAKELDWLTEKFSFIGDAWNSIFGDEEKSVTQRIKQTVEPIKKPVLAAVTAGALAAATPAMATASQVTEHNSYQITIHAQPGQNGADLVDELEREIKRRKMQRNRGAMSDAGDF